MTTGAIKGPLADAVDAFGTGEDSIMDLSLYQWGNAYYNTSKCATGGDYDRDQVTCWTDECSANTHADDCFDKSKAPILCQHGDNECLAMLFMDCVNENYDIGDSFNFQLCNAQAYSQDFRTDRDAMEAANYDCAKKSHDEQP